ncbi:glycosyltransferase family 4 protein [Sporosarcina luteola]|uniref:glycosyltransferase family 4 protein n=1 Tax=Sporosarcina luteola TaxID=582850 RepID=UPI00203C7657|nr:glycosyltransferase family 4 protein [Sporosarcina luteola]MCM3744098.1 glycosyltransferase family 4 protein [Sporosarcina luteola]
MRILYVATVSGTINAFLIPHIRMLIEQGHTVDIACCITNPIDQTIYKYGCKVHEISFSRSPLNNKNIIAYKELKKIISDGKYNIVHTHTPVASFVTRLVCKNIKETKVFYTAHGFHFYKGASIKNWFVYYFIEKWLSKYTDTLITINKEDFERAKKKLKAKRIEYIPGVGLEVEKFMNIKVDKLRKRNEIGVPKDAFTILSVGELNKNKNHEVVIRAFAKLNNSNLHYVICGKGTIEPALKILASDLNVGDRVHLLGFRADIAEICKSSDLFVFPSFREGLPVSMMEAMATGLPVICSDIRGNVDLISDQEGSFLFNPIDAEQLAIHISKVIEDDNIRIKMGTTNKKRIQKYSLSNVLEKIKMIYK